MAASPTNVLLRLALCIVLTTGTLGEVRAQASGSDAERAKNLIVVVTGDLGGTKGVFGAGLLVGELNDYLYIATANHVVRRGPREATKLKVAFYFMPETVEATLMEDVDADLDLAMLRVDLKQHRISLADVPFDVLGDPRALQLGDGLHAIGHPVGNHWFYNITPFPFEQHDGDNLVFQALITQGYSGGGLFDDHWKLVGMVKSTTGGGQAVATSVDRILEKLADWRYPITLHRSEAPVADIRNTKIAFTSRRDGNREIYVMDIDGTNERRLTNNTAQDFLPAWSPDGRQIAFYSYRDRDAEIYVMDIDGTNQRNLTNNSAEDYYPDWSPDGRQIAFNSRRDGNREIYVMAADGTNQRNLTNNTASDYAPAWSPDGQQIAFHSKRDGNEKIYVMAVDGTKLRRLTNNTALEYTPARSPDGRQIAFRAGNSEIYVMSIDGTNERRLTNNTAADGDPTWSPDGRQIVFFSDRDGNEEIYVMDIDGTNERRLTNNTADDRYPAWSPFLK